MAGPRKRGLKCRVKPSLFAIRTWGQHVRLEARKADLRRVIELETSDWRDQQGAAFFNLYSWMDTDPFYQEESQAYMAKYIQKREAAKLCEAKLKLFQLELWRLESPRTPPRRPRRYPSRTPEPLS